MELMDGDSASLPPEAEEAEEKVGDVESTAETETKLETVKIEDFDPKTDQLVEPAKFAPKDLLALLRSIEAEIHQVTIFMTSQVLCNVRHAAKYFVTDVSLAQMLNNQLTLDLRNTTISRL
jgi:hypothetical protein